jgi:putative hydrolase of the HAD superfamily
MPPQFLYFDMGNVLLHFSHARQAEQMAAVAGVPATLAAKVLFEDGLHWDYERGALSCEQFYAQFLERTGGRAELAALDRAANDIFQLNVPMVSLLGQLAHAGYRLGVLSNTSATHWQYCTSRYAMLTWLFSVHALSFRLRALKPQPDVFAQASRLAGVAPASIFFTDDRPEHVAGARAAGWDAVLYESVAQVNEALRQRGVVTNY